MGPFTVLAEVHHGNFTSIYRCRDELAARDVMLKRGRAGLADPAVGDAHVERDAAVRAACDHAHLLALYRLVRLDRRLVSVGPWAAGGTLAEHLGRRDRAAQVRLAVELGAALDALAAAGWVHTDLNISNVLFAGDGRALVCDFATARRVGEAWCAPGTPRPQEASPHTLSPEAWAGAALDGRSDLYALGALIHRDLAGQWPFDAPDADGLARLHLEATPPRASALNPLLGPRIDAFFTRALAKRPAARFQSGAELAAALTEAVAADVPPEEAVAAAPHPVAAAVDAAGAQLERFAATLDAAEQDALRALLERARLADARAVAEVAAMTTELFGLPAALLALESAGAAAALAQGATSAEAAAAAAGAPAHAIELLLGALAAAGLVARRDGAWVLPPPLSALYRGRAGLGVAARPIAEAAAYWARLPRWAASGTPAMTMDRPDGQSYAAVVDALGSLETEPAARLGERLRAAGALPAGARLLDLGAGSGVWSFALAAADAGAVITAVDRPAVLDVLVARAAREGVGARVLPLAGDWREVALPRAAFDVAVIANLCHLESAAQVAELVARAAPALAAAGRLVIVDTVLDEAAPLPVHLYGLRLALRTPRGRLHDRACYHDAIARAGLMVEAEWRLSDGAEGLTALVARRADP